MKSIIFTIMLAAIAGFAYGQAYDTTGITSGKITYDENIRLNFKIEGDAAHLPGMLPKEQKLQKILTFTGEATLFEDGNPNIEEDMTTQHSEGGNITVRMIGSSGSKTYTDLRTGKIIDRKDFMNRIFIVEKPIASSNWKITGNQKTILGYRCVEAEKIDTAGNKTTVWFAPSIKVRGGPAGLGDLPGMILEAGINDGARTFIARSVEPVPSRNLKIQPPGDGKKVTEVEYNKIVADKMKEMGIEQGGEGGQMRIVIKQH